MRKPFNTSGLFATVFKMLPSALIPWNGVWVGSALTSLLFWAGTFLIGLYLGKSMVASSFGAAGTLVVTIVWVYYSAQIFFFGAEFTREYSITYGAVVVAGGAPGQDGQDMLERARRIVEGEDSALAAMKGGAPLT